MTLSAPPGHTPRSHLITATDGETPRGNPGTHSLTPPPDSVPPGAPARGGRWDEAHSDADSTGSRVQPSPPPRPSRLLHARPRGVGGCLSAEGPSLHPLPSHDTTKCVQTRPQRPQHPLGWGRPPEETSAGSAAPCPPRPDLLPLPRALSSLSLTPPTLHGPLSSQAPHIPALTQDSAPTTPDPAPPTSPMSPSPLPTALPLRVFAAKLE